MVNKRIANLWIRAVDCEPPQSYDEPPNRAQTHFAGRIFGRVLKKKTDKGLFEKLRLFIYFLPRGQHIFQRRLITVFSISAGAVQGSHLYSISEKKIKSYQKVSEDCYILAECCQGLHKKDVQLRKRIFCTKQNEK